MKSMKMLAMITGALILTLGGCGKEQAKQAAGVEIAAAPAASVEGLSDEQLDNLARRTYQYVAMYNVNNKFALGQGGWNFCVPNTALKDHTMTDIARPNNDTLYLGCMLDLRKDPVILDIPAFDSKYVSLMVTGYDHYVNVPLSVTKGDFKKPEKVLFFTARTENYHGEPLEGVDRAFEMTGDFVSAVFRVMPHASDKALYEKIVGQMKMVKAMTLSEFQGRLPPAIDDVQFPAVGATDLDTYANNFLEVMQFVVDHTTFDPDSELDQSLLAALKPLGVEPGKALPGDAAVQLDSEKLRAEVEDIRKTEFARALDPAVTAELGASMFRTKENMTLEVLLIQSILGPIGLPSSEAMYPPVTTVDGQPMNAQYDYVIRIGSGDMPPAKAFWSLTLYDSANGFFIPNERKKYSVGENAGMRLDEDGGIAVYVAAQQPEGVPAENWLPINRGDENLDIILRLYEPDPVKLESWQVPRAERLD